MDNLTQYLPFLVPVMLVELILAVTALIHVLKHPKYRFGSRVLWIVVVLFFQIIGPVVYFIFGKGEEG